MAAVIVTHFKIEKTIDQTRGSNLQVKWDYADI